MTKQYRIILVCLLLVLTAGPGAWAAPITGSTQPDTTPDTAAAPTPQADEPAGGDDPDATVIEFSVVPLADDLTQMETIVILKKGGGRSVCVNLKYLITRSYRKRGFEKFDAPIGSALRGLTSGHHGIIEALTETRVTIRPDSPEDTFDIARECFVVTYDDGDAKGCFQPDDDCDLPLEEGDVACIMGTISQTGCDLADHTNLTRQLRIIVALNRPPGEEPITTEVGIAVLPPPGPLEAEEGLPVGPGPAGPTDQIPPVSGGGGGSLVEVPDVIGETLADANALITGVGLIVGTVQTVSADACVPGNVTSESPVAGTLVPEGTAVNLGQCPQVAAIPEPPSVALFAMGLGMLIVITVWRRRRS